MLGNSTNDKQTDERFLVQLCFHCILMYSFQFIFVLCLSSFHLYLVFTLKKTKVFTYTYMTVHILHTLLRVQNTSSLLDNHYEPLIEQNCLHVFLFSFNIMLAELVVKGKVHVLRSSKEIIFIRFSLGICILFTGSAL